MPEILKFGALEIVKPEFDYDGNGLPKVIGVCAVADSQLECYDWDYEDILLIFDIRKPDTTMPLYQFYCMNVSQDGSTGWANEDQVKFTLSSDLDADYPLQIPVGYSA